MIGQSEYEVKGSLFSQPTASAATLGSKPIFQAQPRNASWRQWLTACQLLQSWGDTSTSYMTLNQTNSLFFEEQGRAFLAYRQKWGVALSLGDPVGPPNACYECVQQFLQVCRQNQQTPVFFAIEKNHTTYSELGLARVQVAEDAYLDLTNLQFKGKNWQDVRTALNRAKRENISFHEFKAGQTGTNELLTQIKEVSDQWLHNKNLPQLGFTLGDLTTIKEAEVRTFYASNQSGEVQGLVSWLPMYGAQGWSLDLMRRRDNTMQGLMEFLIASSALRFQAEGFTRLGLGASPFAPLQQVRPLTLLEKLITHLTPLVNHFYRFNSLFEFKRKFQPEWKPLYLFYPSRSALPRISFALASLYLCKKER